MRTRALRGRAKRMTVALAAISSVAVGVLSSSLANAWTPTTPQISVATFGGSAGAAVTSSIKVDATGNIIVAGVFVGTVDFDPGSGVANLTAASTRYSAFVLKLNSSGNYVWAKSFGGSSAQIYKSDGGVELDASGNVFVTGAFYGTVDFDPGSGVANLAAAGGTDGFVLKLNSSGNYVWAKSFGGSSAFMYPTDTTVDASGNVFVAGHFSGTVDFDPGSGVANLTAAGNTDGFVLKLNSSGNYAWVKGYGGSSAWMYYWAGDVELDAAGNIIVHGSFSGTVDFDPGPGVANLTATTASPYVLKLDSLGNYVWSKAMVMAEGSPSSPNAGRGSTVQIDHAGNVILSGLFYGTVDSDPGPSVANLTATTASPYVLKLDSSGNYVWSKALDGLEDVVNELAFYGETSMGVDASGNITVVAGPSIRDCGKQQILRLDSDGNRVWSRYVQGGEVGDCWTSNSKWYLGTAGLYVDAAGNTLVTGWFWGTVDFDPGPATLHLSSVSGLSRAPTAFVLKLDSSGSATSTTTSTTSTSTSTTTTVPRTTTTTVPRSTTTTTSTLPPNLPAPGRFTTQLKDQHISLSWAPVRGAATYVVSRNGQIIARTSWATMFDLSRASIAGTYTYTVRALTASGAAGQISSTTVTVTPPAAPELAASSVLARSLRVTVRLSADTVSWHLLRNGSAIGIYPASRTTITVSQSPGTYSYSLRAVSRTGTTESAQQFSVTVAR